MTVFPFSQLTFKNQNPARGRKQRITGAHRVDLLDI